MPSPWLNDDKGEHVPLVKRSITHLRRITATSLAAHRAWVSQLACVCVHLFAGTACRLTVLLCAEAEQLLCTFRSQPQRRSRSWSQLSLWSFALNAQSLERFHNHMRGVCNSSSELHPRIHGALHDEAWVSIGKVVRRRGALFSSSVHMCCVHALLAPCSQDASHQTARVELVTITARTSSRGGAVTGERHKTDTSDR